MSKTYEPCGAAVNAIVADLYTRRFLDLKDAGLTVATLFVQDGTGEQCLKHAGYAAAAQIKINPLRCRVEGKDDCTIVIDAVMWKTLTPTAQEALIAHELYHVDIQRDDEAHVKLDDIGRPLIKLKKHDRQLGVFDAVVKWYGGDSLDFQAVDNVVRDWKQGGLFDGGSWG